MNRKFKLWTFLIVIILSINFVKAQSTTEEIITEFFKKYQKSPQGAVDYVLEQING